MAIEQRKEPRYDVPDACNRYITLKVKSGHEYVPAIIGNFSRNGILFECPLQLNKGDRAECVLRVNLVVAREITFGVEIKYSFGDKEKGNFIMGASIFSISDEKWFDAFEEIFDFVVTKQGKK